MLERVSGADRLAWLTDPELTLDDRQRARLDGWLARRAAGEPLQHLLGAAPFWGLELDAGPDALVPRPETERLVELALGSLAGRDAPVVIDVGTGSGAIAVAIAVARPDAEVWASDVDPAALALAARNVRAHAPAVRLVEADLLDAPELRAALPRLDLLIANLPYLPDGDAERIPPEVRRDPPRALYGGPDGLDPFRRLWRQLEGALPSGAEAWFELDPRNVAAAAQALRDGRHAPGRATRIVADLAGRDRFLHVGRRA